MRRIMRLPLLFRYDLVRMPLNVSCREHLVHAEFHYLVKLIGFVDASLLGGLSQRERLFVIIDDLLPYRIVLSDLTSGHLRVFLFHKGRYVSGAQYGVIALEKRL